MPIYVRYAAILVVLILAYLAPSVIGAYASPQYATELHILIYIKLPICITAVVVGAAISASASALQVSLQNPLADPALLGISSGASFMAALCLFIFASTGASPSAIFYEYSIYLMPLICFVGACISGACIYAIATRIGRSVASFVLAGIAVSTLFSALVGWLYLIAPAQAMKSLTFWLMGSLSYTNYASLSPAVLVIAIALYILLKKGSQLNKLYLGTQAAYSAGVNTKTLQSQVFLLVALLTGVSVSIAGSVAFLGLLVPHAIRKLHGFNNKTVQSCACFLGASVLMLCAIANEYIFSAQVPLSMITASIGAPLFLYVLFGKKQH